MPQFKRSGKHIFDTTFSKAEQKAVDAEIYRQLAEDTRKHNLEIMAMTLSVLVEEFDFEEDDLRRFFEAYDASVDGLLERYALGEEDRVWLTTHKLKEKGIDIAAWHEEYLARHGIK